MLEGSRWIEVYRRGVVLFVVVLGTLAGWQFQHLVVCAQSILFCIGVVANGVGDGVAALVLASGVVRGGRGAPFGSKHGLGLFRIAF